jgi:ketosteroid isomerase-like protein
MGDQSNSEQSRAVVDAYYQAGVEGHLTDFARYLHPDFTTTVPNYLPWGGVHPGAAFFRDEVLANLPDVFDFGRFRYDSPSRRPCLRSSALNPALCAHPKEIWP